MTILLYFILSSISLVAIASPWLGAVAYYFLALGSPQAIWPWIFYDVRASLMMSVATVGGTIWGISQGRIDFRNLNHKQPWVMLGLCILVNVSHSLSTVSVENSHILLSLLPGTILEIFNKIIFFYFVTLLIINTKEKFHYFVLVLLGVTLLQTYWANNVYFTGEWWRFGDNGRLNGPGDGSADENYFAANLVTGVACLYFVAFAVKNQAIKIGLYLCLPFLWHAIFLTGSRAALIALAAVSISLAIRSRSKAMGVLLLVALFAALIYQGGSMLTRVNDTVEHTENLEEGEQINPRIVSWTVGIQMTMDNPAFGIGVGKFFYAFPLYSDTNPHVAHNTVIQFSAEAGIMAGVAYLTLLMICVFQGMRNRKLIKRYNLGDWHTAYNEMVSSSLLALFCMSLFLDMMLSEYFYYLMLVSVLHNNFLKADVKEAIAREVEEASPENTEPSRRSTDSGYVYR